MVKLYIPFDALSMCSKTKRPDNTLFPDVSAFNVGYCDMEKHIDLILALFELHPEGNLVIHKKHVQSIVMEHVHAPAGWVLVHMGCNLNSFYSWMTPKVTLRYHTCKMYL